MNTGKIHHIELYVSNLSQSVEFWSWLLKELGYSDYQSWAEGRSWKHEDSYVVLVQAEDKYLETPFHRKQVGLNHLAFTVEQTQVEYFREKLQKRGVQILYKDKNYTTKLFFEDPDRIKIELAAY